MSKIIVYKSNRLENMAEKYYQLVSQNPIGPLVTEPVIVQSIGMGRWLSLYLAEKAGIWANFKYYFPNAFMQRLYSDLDFKEDEFKILKKDGLIWIIMQLLSEATTLPEYKILKDYIKNSDRRKYQLSEKIADIFDQYAIYRPEMLRHWSDGKKEIFTGNGYIPVAEDDLWQPLLWRKIKSSTFLLDRAALQNKFLTRIKSLEKVNIQNCPRITVFGVSTLPLYHLELLDALADKISVYFFLLAPSMYYWEDIISGKYKSILDKRALDKDIQLKDLHYEKGNSLLGSLGRLGQDFSRLLSALNPQEASENEDLFKDPGSKNILSCLQSAILNLRDRDSAQDLFGKGTPFVINENDNSLVIHSCHTPMREVEVLYDQVLNILNENRDINPRDILVMTPDIEEYAPYIEAVFGSAEDDKKMLPFSIADRNMQRQSRIADTLINILTLQEKRFALSEVLDLLGSPEVCTAFNLHENDLEKISQWCNQSGIRWGRDENDRFKITGVAYKQNSWQYGLERMLLGYASSGNMEELYEDILPFENIEGSDAVILGYFLDFINKLLLLFNKLNQQHSLEEWSKLIRQILDDFFSVTLENKWEVDIIKNILAELTKSAELVNFKGEIEFEIIFYYLQSALQKDLPAFGFLTGKITFCAMLPMRSIPFKVIALIGMDNRMYPRVSRAVGFDLIYKHPVTGDRSQKNDDRYIFLESILSARKQLYISYRGRSAKDNSIYPPSVLVSELIDYIKENFIDGETGKELTEQKVRELLVIEHPLQHFNKKYFQKDNKIFSFSNDYYETALAYNKGTDLPFFTASLAEDIPDELLNISLGDLINFYTNPSQYILQSRLGIFLANTGAEIEDDEPFEKLSFFTRLQVKEKLLHYNINKNSQHDYKKIFKAAAVFPPGNPGEYLFNQYQLEAKIFSEKLIPFITDNCIEPDKELLKFDLEDNRNLVLSIQLTDLYPAGIIKYRGESFHKDKLGLWINHLALNILNPAGVERYSRFLYPDKYYLFKPVDNPLQYLNWLISNYVKGLKFPLQFFPKVSEKYAEELLQKNKTAQIALNKAIDFWNSEYDFNESLNGYITLAFRNSKNIFDQDFQNIAEQFYAPLFDHLEEGLPGE